MLVKAFGSAVFGIDATTITIEVDVTTGINPNCPIESSNNFLMNMRDYFQMDTIRIKMLEGFD